MSTLRPLSYYGNQINTKTKNQPKQTKISRRSQPNQSRCQVRDRDPLIRFSAGGGSSLCQHLEMPGNEFLSLLVAEAAVQGCQVERGVAQAPPVTLVPVAFALCPCQDQPVEVMQQAVSGTENVLHPQVV